MPHATSQVKSSALGFQFIAFPVEVVRSDAISPAAKLLLCVLMDSARSSRSGMSKLCNATLGARIGKSASEVGRHLAELETAGMVRREYGPSKRIRAGIAITWVPGVQATSEPTFTTTAQPGSLDLGNRVQRGSATIQTPRSEPILQTGPILSNDGGEDQKPSPAEIAASLKAMIAGQYAPQLFDRKPQAAPPSNQREPASEDRPLITATNGQRPPNVNAMCRRVGYSAVAAIVQTRAPRKTADTQLAELAAWSKRAGAPPCPAPIREAALTGRSVVRT